MMTMKEFIDQSGLPEKLVKAVVRQSGGWKDFKEIAVDVSRHGADNGFSGWIYYHETMNFFKKNQDLILEYAEQMADELGEDMLKMIQGFGVFRKDPISQNALAKAIYTGRGDNAAIVHNVLAWFALEEVSRRYDDMQEGS
jgi:hypothetical protein